MGSSTYAIIILPNSELCPCFISLKRHVRLANLYA